MEESSFFCAEYAKPISKKGKNGKIRRLLVLSYILFAAVYVIAFTVWIKLPQLIAILPLLLWIAIYFSWGIVSYECATRVSEGVLSFLKLRGKKEKILCSCVLKDVLHIAPFAEKYTDPLKENDIKIYDHRAVPDTKECYYVLFVQDGAKRAIIFDATEKVIQSLCHYNKNTVKDTQFIK